MLAFYLSVLPHFLGHAGHADGSTRSRWRTLGRFSECSVCSLWWRSCTCVRGCRVAAFRRRLDAVTGALLIGSRVRARGGGSLDSDVGDHAPKAVAHALSLPDACWQDPTGEGDQVAKVGKKIFAFLASDDPQGSLGIKPPAFGRFLRCHSRLRHADGVT